MEKNNIRCSGMYLHVITKPDTHATLHVCANTHTHTYEALLLCQVYLYRGVIAEIREEGTKWKRFVCVCVCVWDWESDRLTYSLIMYHYQETQTDLIYCNSSHSHRWITQSRPTPPPHSTLKQIWIICLLLRGFVFMFLSWDFFLTHKSRGIPAELQTFRILTFHPNRRCSLF